MTGDSVGFTELKDLVVGEVGGEWVEHRGCREALWIRERYFVAALSLEVLSSSNVLAAVVITCQCMVSVRKDPATVEISS